MVSAWNQQVMFPNPADLITQVVSNAKLKLLEAAILLKCDALDGVTDGLLNDPRKCSFNPAVDLPKCVGDVDGPGCFTTAQVTAIKRVYDGPSNASGQIYPGTALGDEAYTGGWDRWYTEDPNIASAYGKYGFNYQNLGYIFSQGIIYHVFNDPSYDFRKFNFETDVPKTRFLGSILNATDPNLSHYKSKGGKLIMYHGWSDPALSTYGTIYYYEQVVNKIGGLDKATEFNRLFLLPGMGHCVWGRARRRRLSTG
jgi:hypothetical protein